MLRPWGSASLVLLLAGAFAPAAAKKPPPPRPILAVTEPSADVVVERTPVPVRIETADAGSGVEAWLNGEPVRLGRRDVRWTARVRDLRPGVNVLDALLTDAGGGTKLVTRKLYVPGAAADLGLAVTSIGTEGAQAVRVVLGTRVAKLGATLNRRHLDDRLLVKAGEQTLALGADDGLRAGKNRLVVTAVTASGGFQRVKLKLRVPAGPVAAAGPDATVRTLIAHELDGSASRGRSLLHWDVVSAPPGSLATLENATGPRPRFRPDLPGTYVLRASAGRSSDTVTLYAQDSSVPPVGAFLQTQADLGGLGYPNTGGVLIDGKIPSLNGVSALTASPGMIMVLLDRSTLEVVLVDVGDSSQVGALVNDLNSQLTAHPHGLIAVLSTPAGTSTQVPNSFFEPLMFALGIDAPSKPGDPNVQNGNPWSAVVTLGGDIATPLVWRSTHDSALAPAYPGNLTGYLQRANGGVGRYTFVPDTHVPFDTSSSSTATSNAMTFGVQTYASDALTTCTPSGTGGFQVVVLRAGTLALVANQTFTTNGGCSEEADQQNVGAMLDLIGNYVAADGIDDYLVAIESIGVPRPTPVAADVLSLSWDLTALAIGDLGGTSTVFSNIALLPGAPQGYALVGYNSLGLPGSPSPFAREASADAPGRPTARIAGMLARNRRNDLVPTVTAVGGPTDTSIATALYQAPTPWPVPSTPGEQAALAYLTNVVAPTMSPPVIVDALNDSACYDPANPSFRAAYCDTNFDTSWSGISSSLHTLGRTLPAGATGFTAGDWKAVCDQLADETKDLGVIAMTIANLQTPFGASAGTATVDLYTPVHDITTALNATDVTPSAGTWLGIVGDLFGLGWAVLPEPANIAAGVFSEMFAMASEGNLTSDGAPALDERVKTEAANLACELTTRYGNASQAIGYMREIIVTDYGKLLAVAKGPGFTDTTLNASEDALQTASLAWAYPPLLGSVFAVDSLTENGVPWVNDAKDFVCQSNSGPPDYFPFNYKPFESATPVMQYGALFPPGGDAAVYILAGPGNPGGDNQVYPPLPPADVLTNLFNPTTSPTDHTNLGVYRPHFFERDIGLSSGVAVQCTPD